VILLAILVFLVACGIIGKLVTRAGDRNNKSFGSASRLGRLWRRSLAVPDPVENPRGLDDGTDFGYKEFD
jgi:hypothetical protein